MPSAELFLRLLEEKELVSAPVLQAARREFGRSPSSDAINVSLWLVQGHHVTASQAERLLAAVAAADQAGKPGVEADPMKKPGVRADQAAMPDAETGQAGKPDVSAGQAGKPEVRPPANARAEEPELTLLDEYAGSGSKATTPAATAPVPAEQPAAAAPPGEKPVKKGPAGKIGGELDSLHDTMKGPLDALIESEGLGGSSFDDPLGGPQLGPSGPKKFKLRRFLKSLFRRNKSKVVTIKPEDPRQVKLILMSWGVACVIVLGVLTTFWLLSPPPASEILQKADAAATRKDYAEAVRNYDQFLKLYPKSSDANDARWKRGLAELQRAEQEAIAAGDWTPAFEVAKKEAPALPKDPADADVMQKTSLALAKIGEGLAQEARARPDLAAVERVQEVLRIIDTDLPENARRPDALLEEVRGILKPVRQEVEGRRDLDAALDAIRAAAVAGDVQAAYTTYRDLVKQYPDLCDDGRLTDAMKAVSTVQQKAVKLVAQALTPAHEERPSGLLAAMPLAVQPRKGEVTGLQGKRLFVVEQGTAYGLDAASGKSLWRRFVALDPSPSSPGAGVTALPLSGPADSDVVLCDPTRREVSRVKGDTGELMWRLTLPQPIVAGPMQASERLLLLTNDESRRAGSQLVLIDQSTGESRQFFQLPQAVGLPPVVDPVHNLIFLAADDSNLFIFDSNFVDSGQCRQVMHVGHEAGRISAPPTIVGDFLLLPVNDSPGKASIRVFSISNPKRERGKSIPLADASGSDQGHEGESLKALQTVRLPGSIAAAPVALGSGAAVVTEQGSLFALERSEAGNPLPFQVAASRPAVLAEKSVHYPISDPGAPGLWVADRQLTRYEVRKDEHVIAPQVTSDDQSMNLAQAPRVEGGTAFLTMKRAGLPGLTVTAFDLEKNKSVWQTWVAAPLAAAPTLGSASGKLTVVTASGGMFRESPEEVQRRMDLRVRQRSNATDSEVHPTSATPWEPVLTVDSARLSKPLVSLLPLPGEMFALSSGANTRQIVIYDPKEQDKQFRWLLSPREMSVAPGLFAGGLLTPCENGEVFLLDPEGLGPMAKPLPPALEGVNVWDWRTPVAVDDQSAVLCDGDKRLAVVTISNTDDAKVLKEAVSVTSKTGLVSPIAVLGKAVFVADSDAQLLSFQLPGLTPGKSQALGSRCVAGPYVLKPDAQARNVLVLMATEKNRLFAVNEQQRKVWDTALGYGPLAGAPYLAGGEIYLSARSGMVWRISAADGKELGKVDAGCPLGSGPLVIGERIVVGGHEGSLLVLKKP